MLNDPQRPLELAVGALNAGALRVFVLPYPLEQRPEADVRRIALDHWPSLLACIGALDE